MWKEPALWFIVFAVLLSFLARWIPMPRREVVTLPSVFVCVVSYCDTAWPSMVQHMLETASARDTLRIGVVEFVRGVEESREAIIPVEWRHAVRVYTASHRAATTQRAARRMCVDQLYQGEAYCLLLCAAHMRPEWDERLFSMLSCDRTVLSSHLRSGEGASFPCLAGDQLTHRDLTVSKPLPVPSLVAQSEFMFVPRDALELALCSSDDIAVSARLTAAGFPIRVPGVAVATRARHPAGVAVGRPGARSTRARAYADERGFGSTPTAHARLGLLPDADGAEFIAKYGSVVGARLAIQEEEAEMHKGAAYSM